MKTRVICVRTGDKYNQWFEDNLKHMVDNYSGLDYDEFIVINDNPYDDNQVFNKLLMFDRYRDGQNIYFDLDIIIKGDCNQFLTKDLHVCHAWWRPAYHTPLNSSIISWQGDRSRIYDYFKNDADLLMMRYNKGMDQYLWEIHRPKTYKEGFCSFQTVTEEEDYSVYLFNQRYQYLTHQGWWTKFQLHTNHTPIELPQLEF